MNLEEYVKNIMGCHREALKNPNHVCHHTVREYLCEPFRLRDCSRMNDLKVMLLGLSPGRAETNTPKIGAQLEEVVEYLQKPILQEYDTNYKHAMTDRVGSKLEYVKANVVHGIFDKESAHKCLETCGNKFLLPMLELFRELKYIIVYDFNDKKVLNFVSEKLNISPPLNFNNSTADKGVPWNGVTVIAARRTQKFIRRLSQ